MESREFTAELRTWSCKDLLFTAGEEMDRAGSAVFLRVREDKPGVLKDWVRELRQREDEVLESFRNGGTRHEAAYLLEDADGPVLVHAQETVDPQTAHRAFRESELAIDLKHRQVMQEVVVGRMEAEELLNLSMGSSHG